VKHEEISWLNTIFIITYHLLLLITGILYILVRGLPPAGMWIALTILFVLIGLSVTAGYHRLYAHRSYQTTKLVEIFLLFFGARAAQNSVLKWSFDHRMHHRFVDTDKDPYSIKKGFWYAHILWIFKKSKHIDMEVVADLSKNKLVVFQDRHYPFLYLLGNLTIITFIGYVLNDYAGAFVFCYLLRTFLIHHFTFFINSLAHYWGSQTYSKEFSAVDNYIVSLVSFGEGYHNYHHTFSSDYRNGIRWYHFDPTKWIVWALSKVGITKRLIAFNQYTIKNKVMQKDKHIVLDKLKEAIHDKKEELITKVHSLSAAISNCIAALDSVKKEYVKAKQVRTSKEKLVQLKIKMKQQTKALKNECHAWNDLVKQVTHLTRS